MNIVIFGAGIFGKGLFNRLCKNNDDKVICFLDNAKNHEDVCGVKVYTPDKINELSFDKIIICNEKSAHRNAMKQQLKDLGVNENLIKVLQDDENLYNETIWKVSLLDEDDTRIQWIRGFAEYVKEQNMEGSTAECGVLRGDCSHYINKYFPDRTLYLCDTFAGFNDKDLAIERGIGDEKFIKGPFNYEQHFEEGTTMKQLELKMPHFDKCVIKKGYFPESAKDIDDKFVFVNLDMDLYQPQLAGLNFFYDKMVKGGIILLHDYFSPELPGVKKAVMDFQKQRGTLPFFPIGDFCSIALIKA